MEIKIKIIEFSSDIFSKPAQLKDIEISPLFSNTEFKINIYDAISKNEIYDIKANSPTIKIGLYKGKSLLGTGEFSINKKIQKIKLTSEGKNKSIFYENINDTIPNNPKPIENDYFLTLECTVNNSPNTKHYSKATDSSVKKKRKKNGSVDVLKTNKNNDNDHSESVKDKKIINDTPTSSKTRQVYEKEPYSQKKYNNNNLNLNNLNANNKLAKINTNTNKNKDYPNNRLQFSNIAKTTYGNNLNNTNLEKRDSVDAIENESYYNNVHSSSNSSTSNVILQQKRPNKYMEDKIVNPSFDNDLNNDNIILNPKEYGNSDNELKNFLQKLEKFDTNQFNLLLSDFNLIYNNLYNLNENDNYFYEYQYFMEKLCDILSSYKSLFNKISKQNISIKKFIKNFSEKIRSISKKGLIIKIQTQKKEMQEIFREKISNNYFQNEISNINHKFSLVNTLSNDVIKDCDSHQKNINNNYLKEIFANVINTNKNSLFYIKQNQDLLSKIKILNVNFDFILGDAEEDEETDGPDNRVDIESLKSKINKLKQKYLDENGIKSNPYDDKTGGKAKNKKNKTKSKGANKSYTKNDY